MTVRAAQELYVRPRADQTGNVFGGGEDNAPSSRCGIYQKLKYRYLRDKAVGNNILTEILDEGVKHLLPLRAGRL